MRKPEKKRRLRTVFADKFADVFADKFADNLPATSGLPVLTGYPIVKRPR
jgi:hypothetical protein